MKEFFLEMTEKDCWYRHMRNKIIFGTDWYLTLLTPGKAPYHSFCESFYNICKEANDANETFWFRFSLVNPATFYGLDNHEMLAKMNLALKGANANEALRTNGLKRMLNIKTQVDQIKKELSKVS
ncbi:MAG: hypothetical protein GF344_07765 [Chitinivibrionales bacterium]|nr:hypothetical protein [Chitinivibrionales bacterium]